MDKNGFKGKLGMKLELIQLRLALSCPEQEITEADEVDGPVLSSSSEDEIDIHLPKKKKTKGKLKI